MISAAAAACFIFSLAFLRVCQLVFKFVFVYFFFTSLYVVSFHLFLPLSSLASFVNPKETLTFTLNNFFVYLITLFLFFSIVLVLFSVLTDALLSRGRARVFAPFLVLVALLEESSRTPLI